MIILSAKEKKEVLALIFLFAWGFFCLASEAQAEHVQRPCGGNSPKSYKIGSHIFILPASYQGLYAKNNDDEHPFKCDGSSGQPTELTEFSFFPLLPGYQNSANSGKPWFITSVGLTIPPEPHHPEDNYDFAIKQGWLNKSVKLSKFPIEHGFYIAHYTPSHFLLIAADKKFRTPKGNPVTFSCVKIQRKNSLDGFYTRCDTRISWKENIQIGIVDIDSNWVPIGDLKKFYEQILESIEKMEVKNNQSKFTSNPPKKPN